jgi:putative DNA primase/helicase
MEEMTPEILAMLAEMVDERRDRSSSAVEESSNVWSKYNGAVPTTHVGSAEAIYWYLLELGHEVAHVPGFGVTVYVDGRWALDEARALRTLLHRAGTDARAMGTEAWVKFGDRLGMKTWLDATVSELATVVPERPASAFDSKEHLLLVKNGVVDLRTGQLMAPKPSMLLSQRIDVAYDPDAAADRWRQFLVEVMSGDAGMAGFLQRLIGYSITGSTREQAYVVLWGRGANGKSLFVETLSHVFSAVTRTLPFSVFEGKGSATGPTPELATLHGARLAFTSEGEAGTVMREALVKSVTGSDVITARRLYSDGFSFSPTHQLICATNHKPRFQGSDEGLWRRVRLVGFERTFAVGERDYTLAEKLRSEAEGILAWAIAGAVEWYASGLQEPDRVLDDSQNYRDQSDLLMGYLPGVLELDPEASVTLKEAFSAWEKHCGRVGEQETYSNRWLADQLEQRGVEKRRRGSGMHLIGVKIAAKYVEYF